jgi:hypothetical protein
MAYIEVDHSVLTEVAENIHSYCFSQDFQMRIADSEVKNMLVSDWIGADAQAFGGKWEAVDNKDSVAIKFRDSLKNYADCISACAKLYKTAQADSFNDANRLPR